MAYGDDWEREFHDRMNQWSSARWWREWHERTMHPDQRLDEVGWDIFYCCIARGLDERTAAREAMQGAFRQRRRVRDDMWERHAIALRRRYAELHPETADLGAFETQAPEQLEFWKSKLVESDYVYFIQSGEDGPVKIGRSIKPERRLPQLQTGNPDELLMRHVIPGDLAVERQLHRRFADARVRGEWFGREYLPIILAFAGGLANRMIHAYDGSGYAPEVTGGDVRTPAEIQRIRKDIERLWRAGHDVDHIAELTWLEVEEIQRQLTEMRAAGIWDVHTPGGYWFYGSRAIPRSPRPRSQRPAA